MKTIAVDDFIKALSFKQKCIDVRAPIEFSQGAIPGSVNIPLLNDKERAIVGTCYKQNGQAAAIKLGHKIVSGENKSLKINQWKDFLIQNPKTIITCFRGGLRSQTTQIFLKEIGFEVLRLDGGYKKIRQTYLDKINEILNDDNKNSIIILTGETGSAKTEMIRQLANCPNLDLEKYAEHKGSAFGKTSLPQPSQATFENIIAQKLFEIDMTYDGSSRIIVEDESRAIGSLHLPEPLFNKMRASSVVKIIEPIQNRIDQIYSEYVTDDIFIYDYFKSAIQRIHKKLGGLRSQELLDDIEFSRKEYLTHSEKRLNKIWIEKLLVWYYDPLYQSSFKIRNPKIEFSGSYREVKNYLEEMSQRRTSKV